MDTVKKLVIVGASGHGKVVADIAIKSGYGEIVFLDDDERLRLTDCAGFSVVGQRNKADIYKNWDFIVAIGNATTRQGIQEELEKKGCQIITLIHPEAVISRRVEIGRGTVVMPGAVINSDTVIGKGCIINTSSSVDHDGKILDFVHVSIGAHIAGTVQVATRTWIGAGATILNNVNICSDCVVGAGSVVLKDIDISGTYVGVPAKRMIK